MPQVSKGCLISVMGALSVLSLTLFAFGSASYLSRGANTSSCPPNLCRPLLLSLTMLGLFALVTGAGALGLIAAGRKRR